MRDEIEGRVAGRPLLGNEREAVAGVRASRQRRHRELVLCPHVRVDAQRVAPLAHHEGLLRKADPDAPAVRGGGGAQ